MSPAPRRRQPQDIVSWGRRRLFDRPEAPWTGPRGLSTEPAQCRGQPGPCARATGAARDQLPYTRRSAIASDLTNGAGGGQTIKDQDL